MVLDILFADAVVDNSINLTTKVNNMIEIPKLPPDKAKNTTKIFTIGRVISSLNTILKGFINNYKK